MRNNLELKLDDGLNKLLRLLYVLLPLVALAFPIKVTSFFIGAIVILWLVLTMRFRDFTVHTWGVMALLPIINYMILALGLLHTANMTKALRLMETKIPLLVFPLICFTGYNILRNVNKKQLLLIYSIGVILICSYIFVYIFLTNPIQTLASYSFKAFSGSINIHPGYLSLYVGMAVIILLTMWQDYGRLGKALLAAGVLFLFGVNLLLVARMPLAGLILAIISYFLIFRRFKMVLLILVAFLLFVMLIGYQNPDWGHRILGPVRLAMEGKWNELQYFAYDRVQELTCAKELITENLTWLTGLGTGDDEDAVLACYQAHGFDWVLSQKYNAHNQYLQCILQNGIVSGILCLALISAPLVFRVSSTRHATFYLFSILFTVFSLTESTLEVQKGQIFFSFFYCLFVHGLYTKKEPSLKKARNEFNQ